MAGRDEMVEANCEELSDVCVRDGLSLMPDHTVLVWCIC
jgi:hypothetical protein